MSELFIHRTNPMQQLEQARTQSKGALDSSEFSQVLKETLEEVDLAHKTSNQGIQEILAGDVKDVHSAMIALQKADLSFQMMVQVRNKLVDAYHEIMRMQV
jgi:flagellar hook-basal body complex protein FliE